MWPLEGFSFNLICDTSLSPGLDLKFFFTLAQYFLCSRAGWDLDVETAMLSHLVVISVLNTTSMVLGCIQLLCDLLYCKNCNTNKSKINHIEHYFDSVQPEVYMVTFPPFYFSFFWQCMYCVLNIWTIQLRGPVRPKSSETHYIITIMKPLGLRLTAQSHII